MNYRNLQFVIDINENTEENVFVNVKMGVWKNLCEKLYYDQYHELIDAMESYYRDFKV